MDFSEDWKAYFPICSVACPPLLLSEPSTLGPLLFSPSPGTRRTVYSSPCVHFESDDFSTISKNNLGWLKCPDNDILFFFPIGDNLHQLGFVKLSLKEGENVEPASDCEFIGGRIVKIMVTSVYDAAASAASAAASAAFAARYGCLPPVAPSYFPLGFLLACTTHFVHWFRIDWTQGKHELVKLCSKQFSASVVHACWSPHVKEEGLVLLDGGELILFNVRGCSGTQISQDNIKVTRIDVLWKDSDLGLLTSDTKWLSCEFGYHFWIFVVACSDVVYEVDFRFSNKGSASILAKIEFFAAAHSDGPDEFVTFCRAGSEGYYFSIASKYGLYLLDTRKALSPVLQWAHNLDKPTHMQVFKLSQLRNKVKHGKYSWATKSGFAILLGSFWNDDFSFFFYGPPLPAPPESIASKLSDLCHTFYAWGLPSHLSLSGRRCYSGDCLIQEFLKENRPKKEIVLGFCIVNEDLSDIHLESGVDGSFGLIRLVSSGKIESQIYNASWKFVAKEPVEPSPSTDEDFHMDSFTGRKFKYLHLDYLLAYLFGDLAKEVSKEGSSCTQSYTQEKYEYLQNHLKTAGVDKFGSQPDIPKVLTSVSVPMSTNEIAVSRMWTGLSIGVLQLGFSLYPELQQVILDGKKVFMDFLYIPKSPQLPPYLLRKPSRRNKESEEVQPGDDLLGPVLPLPVLLDLHRVEKEMTSSAVDNMEVNEFSFETKLTRQCNEIMTVANVMGLRGSSPEFLDSYAVSLDDDRDENCIVSQEVKSLIFYEPTAFTSENSHSVKLSKEKPVPGDTPVTFIMKASTSASGSKGGLNGLEMIDYLCPIELEFDSPIGNFEEEELDALKLLKKQNSQWQQRETAAFSKRWLFEQGMNDAVGHAIFSDFHYIMRWGVLEKQDTMITKFHVALILVFLVVPSILFQLKNKPLHAGCDIVVKKLEGFKSVICDFSKQYPLLTLMYGTAIIAAYAWLVWVNQTYERMLLWFVGFVKRNGLDKVMTRRVLKSMTGLMAVVVIEIESIIVLTFLSSVFVTLVSLVVVAYDNDTTGFTEGVCICFLYHALACFSVSGIALVAKLTGW